LTDPFEERRRQATVDAKDPSLFCFQRNKMPFHYAIIVDVGLGQSVGEHPRNSKLRDVVLTKMVPKLEKTNSMRVLTSDE